MRKRFIARVTVFLMLISMLSGMVLSASAASDVTYVRDMTADSAKGTYYVETEEDLNQLAALVNSGKTMSGYTFLQTADITLTAQNFTPIGNFEESHSFRGTYDGQRHTISNLQVNDGSVSAGLFGYAMNAKLRNIGIESGNITASERAGGIAASGYNCTILNCYNKASVTVSSSSAVGAGGIVGVARTSSKFYGCFNTGTITCNTTAAGGIVGWGGKEEASLITVNGCYSGGSLGNTGTLASKSSLDVICRDENRVVGDFSSNYYLAGIYSNSPDTTDTYNHRNAVKLEAADPLLMAYVLNHAQGGDTNTNAFTVKDGALVFSADETEGVTDLRLKVWQDGVLLEDTGYSRVTAGGYAVPATYDSAAVLSAEANGTSYAVGDFIPAGARGVLTVELYLSGDYPSFADYETNTAASVFTISTVAELAKLAELVDAGNSFEGKSFYVTADLDFADYGTWNPIGLVTGSSGGEASADSMPFSGTFDGQYHHFKNINFKGTTHYMGLFAYAKGAVLRNIILDEGTVYSSGKQAGALASLVNSSTVTNIENHISVYSDYTAEKDLNLGVIALSSQSAVSNIVSYGDLGLADLETEQENGGIVGYGFDTSTVDNVIVAGTVSGTDHDPIARGCTITDGYYLSSHAADGTMTWNAFLSGEAAWTLNQNSETDVWSKGEEGPVLDPDHPVYRMTYTLNETDGLLSGTYYTYYNAGSQVTLPKEEGFALLNVGKDVWPLADSFTMPIWDDALTLYYSENAYNINYVLNGGSFVTEPATVNTSGTVQQLPTAWDVEREGYVFAGWYDNAELTGEPVTETVLADYHDVVYYAAWSVPEKISTAAQLAAIKMDGQYILTQDIDLTDVDFTPIGSAEDPFTGIFDGNGHTISGLTIQSTEDHQGLFGVNAGVIRNVNLAEDCTVSGNAYVGGIAGSNTGVIYNCVSRAAVKASNTYTATSIKLMVQNLQQSPDATRLKYMKTRIDNCKPDILLLQEGDPDWISFLEKNYSDTGEYDLLYRYRYQYGDGDLGDLYEYESTPVLYRTDKFEKIESGHFWLSKDPENCSRPDNAAHFRICTWAVLKDKASGQLIAVFPVHLDNNGEKPEAEGTAVRNINAQALKNKMDEIAETYQNDRLMMITAGDFNCNKGTEPYEIIAGDNMTTVVDYNPESDNPVIKEIDHILVSENTVKAVDGSFKYLTDKFATEPSDHAGLSVELETLANCYIGGIAGSSSGTVSRCIADGTVSGSAEYGSLIGWNTGDTESLYYAEQTDVPGLGRTNSSDGVQAIVTDAAAVTALNAAAEKAVFTLDESGNAAVRSSDEDPACIVGSEVYAAHQYADPVTVAPTCEEGYTAQVCSVCGYEKRTDVQPAVGHAWSAWTSYGNELYHYRICSYNEEHIEYADHAYAEQYHAAACGSYGYTRYSCECGHYYDEIDSAPLNHIWGEYQDCDDQNHQQHCQRDDSHVLLSAHTLTATSIAVDCETAGGTQYDCASCGHTHFVKEAEALGHAYGSWTMDETSHQKVCANDASHVLSGTHNMTETVVAATCEESGYTRHTCTDCGYTYDTDITAATGHEYELNEETQAYTCHCGVQYQPAVDLDGDGEVTVGDVIPLLRAIDGWDSGLEMHVLDVSGDGKLNVFDAVRFLQLLS